MKRKLLLLDTALHVSTICLLDVLVFTCIACLVCSIPVCSIPLSV